jgi:peptide/nickel transport system ATP-binding protein
MTDLGSPQPLVQVAHLTKRFPIRSALTGRTSGYIHAVEDVSFEVPRGATLGLVGESGCGKSTTALMLGNLLKPTSGAIQFDGVDLGHLNREANKALRRRMQFVFQNPYGSLNPRLTVEEIVSEPLIVHRVGDDASRRERCEDLLGRVGLRAGYLDRRPNQLSGGQRQRISIARALALGPELLILDEPVSALDVSVQAQVVNLLRDLQRDLQLTYVFVAHDLSIVRHISDHVVVMYLGRVVESGTRDDVFDNPSHPYTRVLLDSVPAHDPAHRRIVHRTPLGGELPSPADPPSGCVFRTRCPIAQPECAVDVPPPAPMATSTHRVACLFPERARTEITIGTPVSTGGSGR